MTVTIPLWLPLGYLLLGLVLWLPLEYLTWSRLYRPPPFWSGLREGIKRKPVRVLVILVAWPVIVKDALTLELRHPRRRKEK